MFLSDRRIAEKEKVRRRLLSLVLNTPACNLERAIAEESERLTYKEPEERNFWVELGISIMLMAFIAAVIVYW